MSNYDRTMELVDAANNSTGASQKQFEKTTESLEAKVNKLKNAWNEFLMGIANSNVIKGAVSLLTTLLNGINKITNGLSGGKGLIKSLMSVGVAFGSLKLGKNIFNGLIKSAKGAGKEAAAGYSISFYKGTQKMKIQPKKKLFMLDPKSMGKDMRQLQQYALQIDDLEEKGKKGTQEYQNLMSKHSALAKKIYADESGYSAALKDETTGIISLTGAQQKAMLTAMANNEITESQVLLLTDSQKVKLADALATRDQAKAHYEEALKTGNAAVIQAAKIELDKAEAAVTWKVANAKAAENALNKGGIIGLLTLIGMVVTHTAAKEGEKVSIWGVIKAKLLETLVQKGLNTQMLIGLGIVAGIIALVVGLTIAIIALTKHIKNVSLEGRMKSAAERTKAAQEAAEGAKSAYDDLLSGRDEYNDLQNSLDELTKGTIEWKQALVEANQQVIELLSKYPLLAQYLKRGESGQLTISDEGWDEVIKNQDRAVKNTSAAVLSSQIDEQILQNEKATQDLQRSFEAKSSKTLENPFVKASLTTFPFALTHGNPITAAILSATGLTSRLSLLDKDNALSQESAWDKGFIYEEDTMNKMLEAYKEDSAELFSIDENGEYSDALKAIAVESGYSAEELYGLKDAMAAYDAAIVESEAVVQGQAEAMLTARASQDTLDYEYGEEVITAFSKQMTGEDYTSKIDKRKKEIYRKGGNDFENEKMRVKALAEEYHVLSKMTGSDLENLQVLYSAMAGIDISEIPENIKKDKNALAKEIADMDMSEEISENIEKIRTKMSGLTEETQKELAALISGDFGALTAKEFAGIKTIDTYAEKLGYSVEELAGLLGYEEKDFSALDDEDKKAYLEKMKGIKVERLSEEQLQAEYDRLSTEPISAEVQFRIDTEQNKELLKTQRKKLLDYFSNIDAYSFVSGYSKDTLQKLSDQTQNMGAEDAKAYLTNFNKVINSKTGETKEKLENYLSGVDWSSMMQAINAVDFMGNMGVDESIIDSYWQAAVDGANTYIKTIEEAGQLTEYFQNKAKTATEIKERLISGEATSEDLQELIDAGIDLTGQLQLTAKGWKMSEDAAEAATQKLLENNAKESQMAAEQQHEAYIKAFKVSAKKNGAGIRGEGITKTEVDQTGKTTYIAGDFEAADRDTKNLIASQLGVEEVEGETQEEYWERAKQAYLDYVDQLNNGEAINEIADMDAAFANAQIYSADESASRGYDESTVRYSMQSEAERAGLDSGEVTDYSDYLMEVNNNLKYNQALSDRVAIANAKMNDGLKKLTDTYDDWNGLLDKNGKIRKNLSEEEATAYQQMKRDTAEMLGVNGELSDSFFENTNAMELLAKAAQGDTSALEQLQKLAAQDYIVSVLLDDESLDEDARSDLQELSNFIMNYDLPELEAGVELDDTNFINICNGLIRNSKLTAGQINEIFGRIGYKATLKPHTEYVKIPRMGANNTIVGWTSRAVQVYDLVTLTSSGSGGGGVTRTAPRTSGGGGGGGSSNKSEDWENPYDHLYNLTEKINNSLRIREKLERDYDRILSNRSKNAEDIYNNMMKQIGALEREKKLQEEMLSKRKKEATDTMKKNSALNKYAWIEYDKSGNAYVQINWDLIDKVKDEEKGQKIEDYVSDLEEVRDQINDANDGLDDIEDRLGEIYELGKDEYFDFEDKVLEAIVADRQKAIDELSAINDSINDTNQKIIDSIQSEIDKVRQDRENEKKEEEISDKQRRLAYLQMDTSGANQLEILKLQDEIQEAQEDYTDTLIDQKISELQEQNDKAAEQRETQIQIMERQLEHDQETGALWTEAYALIKGGVDENGKLIQGSRLEQLLQSTDGYAGLSNIGKMNWLNDIEESLKLVVNYLRVGRSTEGLVNTGELTAGQTITFTTGSGQVATGTVRENGKVTDASGNVYSGVYQDYSGKFVTEEGFMGVTGAQKDSFDKLVESGVINTPDYWIANQGEIEYLPELIDRLANSVSSVDSNIYSTAESAIDALYKSGVINSPDYWKSNYKKLEYLDLLLIRAANHLPIGLTHYKTGGVADFTGPAWLDGTPSKPEIILNQKDSQNFIQLKDILANIMNNGNNGTSENNGDNYFDVDINVESLSEDYDIERVAEDVKNLIVKDAAYRNVNAINRLR